MKPVPHVPARAVGSAAQLRDWLADLAEIGVDTLLLIAGDLKTASGPYENTLAILDSGLLLDHGFRRLGIAGYPEGHPSADRRDLDRALAAKIDYADSTGTEMWMVTQFVFSSDPAIAWLRRMREIGCALPAHIGMPGPAKLKALIAYAAQCGVDAAARALIRRPSAARLLGRWTPNGLAQDLAYHRTLEPDTPFRGIHLFPFGGVVRSARWLRDLRTIPGGDDDNAKTNEMRAVGSPL